MEIIQLINEEGIEEDFELIATFGVDDKDYAALNSLEEDITFILRIEPSEDDEGFLLHGIEDEEELEAAIEVLEELELENLD